MDKFLLISGFTIFGLNIRFYGILMSLAFIAGLLIVMHLAKQKGFDKNLPYDLILIAFPLAIVGARLNYVLFTPQNNWTFAEILSIWHGGLMIYGGVLFAGIGIAIYCIAKKYNILKVFDIIAPALILGQAIGRWGNFFNQEAYGSLITNPNFQWFPFGVWIEQQHFTSEAIEQIATAGISATDGAWFNATFFYESLWCFLGFFLLFYLCKKTNKTGLCTATYFAYYGIERFFVEMLRTDSLYLGNVKISVLVSAILFATGLSYLICLLVKDVRQKKLAVSSTNTPQPQNPSTAKIQISQKNNSKGKKAVPNGNSKNNPNANKNGKI